MCVFSFTCDAGRARSRINAPHAGFRVFACSRGCCRWPVQSLRLPQRPRGRKRRHRRHGGYLVIARHRLAAVRRCSTSGRRRPRASYWNLGIGWTLTMVVVCKQSLDESIIAATRRVLSRFKKNSFRGTGGWLTRLRSVARPVVFIMRLNWRLKSQARSPKKSGLRGRHLRKKLLFPAVLIISPTCAC